MFERQVLGEDYWAEAGRDRARCCFPSGAPASDALVRGEVSIAPLLYNIVYTKKKDGAPVEIILRARGRAGESLRRRHPEDGEASQRRQAVPELVPVGGGPDLHDQGAGQPDLAQEGAGLSRRASIRKVVKVWVPNFKQYVELRKPWTEEWNKTYSYRQ